MPRLAWPSATRLPLPFIMASICLLLGTASPGLAGQWQSQQSIREAAREFVMRTVKQPRLQVEVGQLDERLRMERCSTTLQAYFPLHRNKLGPTTVGVRCEGDQPWKVFVPVNIRAYGTVLVARHSLPRNTVLRASDVKMVQRDLSRYEQGFYTEPRQVIGMVVKYSIGQGSVLTSRGLKPRQLVSRGQSVTIIAEHDGLTIRVDGEALMDGANGDTIRVKNSRSKREIDALVVAPQTVKVKL